MKDAMSLALTNFIESDKLLRVLPNRSQSCSTCQDSHFIDHHHFIVDQGLIEDPLADIPSLGQISCSGCGSSSDTLKVCSSCGSTFYCSKKCQVNSWPNHKTVCKSTRSKNGGGDLLSQPDRIIAPKADFNCNGPKDTVDNTIRMPRDAPRVPEPTKTVQVKVMPPTQPAAPTASKPELPQQVTNKLTNPPQTDPELAVDPAPVGVKRMNFLSSSNASKSGTPKLGSILDQLSSSENVSAVVTQAWNPGTFKYFILFDVDKFVKICNELNAEFANRHVQLSNANKGDIIAVQASDQEWYRGFVMQVNPNKSLKVIMVDPGYIEDVTVYASLPVKYHAIPSLVGFVTPSGSFDKESLEQVTGEDPVNLSVTVLSINDGRGKVKVHFKQLQVTCEMTVLSYVHASAEIMEAEKNRSADAVEAPTNGDPLMVLPKAEFKVGSTVEVVVVYQEVDDPSYFYVLGDTNVLRDIMSAMAAAVEDGVPVKPDIGMNVLAKSLMDGDWYRAVVTGISGKKVTVYYMDFGNYDEMDGSSLKSLSPSLSPEIQPAQGVRCRLSGVQRTMDYNTLLAAKCTDGEVIPIKFLAKEDDHYLTEVK